MANLRDIKRRIKAVNSTAQVTRAMQLVAASKMKRAQQSAIQTRPYSQLLAQIFKELSPEIIASHPLLAPHKKEAPTRGIVVIAPDKGLCGGLITNLNKAMIELPKDAVYIAVGRRAAMTLKRLKRNLVAVFEISDKLRFSQLRPVFELALKPYKAKEVDSFEVLFSSFVNPLKQIPTVKPLLPMTNLEAVIGSFNQNYAAEAPIANDTRPFILEPSAEALLNELVPLFIKQELFHCALEAKASEHSARMVAMKSATDNAKSLASDLTLTYNKARQAAITQEIIELASGASKE